MPKIYPSLLGVPLFAIEQDIAVLEPYCAGFHLDLLDNHFAPNLGFSFSFTNDIAQRSEKPTWVHLMIEHPEQSLDRLKLKAGSIVSFHGNVLGHLTSLIKKIHGRNWYASATLSPNNPISSIEPLLPIIDQLLIMGVNPGFSGQSFITNVFDTINAAVKVRKEMNLSFRIGIDGGVTADNIEILKKLGVDDFAVSSAIFAQANPLQALKQLNQRIGI